MRKKELAGRVLEAVEELEGLPEELADRLELDVEAEFESLLESMDACELCELVQEYEVEYIHAVFSDLLRSLGYGEKAKILLQEHQFRELLRKKLEKLPAKELRDWYEELGGEVDG